MTIVVGVACHEGLVVSADRRTVLTATGRVSTDHAHKLFELGSEGRYAAATYGVANPAGLPVSALMNQFAATQVEPASGLDEMIENFTACVDASVPDATGLGFIMAGYDDQGVGRIRVVDFPPGEVPSEPTTIAPGSLFRGE